MLVSFSKKERSLLVSTLNEKLWYLIEEVQVTPKTELRPEVLEELAALQIVVQKLNRSKE
jgi:hypothetical protein